MKISNFLVSLLAGFLLCSCASIPKNNAALSNSTSLNSQVNEKVDAQPVLVFVKGGCDNFYTINSVPGVTTINFKYNWLDSIDGTADEFLKEFSEIRRNNPNTKFAIGAHSLGNSVVLVAFQKDTKAGGTAFRGVSFLMISPTICGVSQALNTSGWFFAAMTRIFSGIGFMRDYHEVAKFQDPVSPDVRALVKYFPEFQKKTAAQVFFEKGDKYLPTENNLELLSHISYRPTPSNADVKIALSNLIVLSKYATTLEQNGDKEPHSDILNRPETILAVRNLLFNNGKEPRGPLVSSARQY